MDMSYGQEEAWDGFEGQERQEAEREALQRIAKGTATKEDAVLLAVSLNHADLFIPQEPTTYGYDWEER